MRGGNRPARTPHAAGRWAVAGAGLLALLLPACDLPGPSQAEREVQLLRERLDAQNRQLESLQGRVAELQQQLTTARGLTDEDLAIIFHADRIVIDPLTGGYDADDQPGDEGVTVYVRPVDRFGDTLKAAGSIQVELFDLARAPANTRIGLYELSPAEARDLWFGDLWTEFYVVKCPWQGGPPAHRDLLVRVTFVDYLTRRVMSATHEVTVNLPQ